MLFPEGIRFGDLAKSLLDLLRWKALSMQRSGRCPWSGGVTTKISNDSQRL